MRWGLCFLFVSFQFKRLASWVRTEGTDCWIAIKGRFRMRIFTLVFYILCYNERNDIFWVRYIQGGAIKTVPNFWIFSNANWLIIYVFFKSNFRVWQLKIYNNATGGFIYAKIKLNCGFYCDSLFVSSKNKISIEDSTFRLGKFILIDYNTSAEKSIG